MSITKKVNNFSIVLGFQSFLQSLRKQHEISKKTTQISYYDPDMHHNMNSYVAVKDFQYGTWVPQTGKSHLKILQRYYTFGDFTIIIFGIKRVCITLAYETMKMLRKINSEFLEDSIKLIILYS